MSRRISKLSRLPALWATLGLLLLTSPEAPGAPAQEPKHVLVLHSYGQDFAPYSDLAPAFREELTRQLGQPIDLVEVSLVTTTAGAALEDEPFADYLEALLVGRPPDLIATMGGPAAAFAQRQRNRLFVGSPMLYVGVDERTVAQYTLTDRNAVLATRLDVAGFIQNIVEVLPNTAHVAVVVGNSPIEQFWKAEMQQAFRPFMDRIEFSWLDGLAFDEMKQRVATLPPDSAVLYTVYVMDGAGVPRTRSRGLKDIRDAANAPVFGIFASNIDEGEVGGRLVSDRELGQNAAHVALRVLQGESPGTFEIPALGPGSPVYNWNELQRWGIAEAGLPAGSTVRFREPTAWERYRPYVLAAVTILLLQTALIAALFWQRVRLRRAKRESASFSGRLLMVHENERRRVARELHDDVTQRLAALAIEATRMEDLHLGAVDEAIRSIRDGLIHLSEDVHGLSYRLHPSVIEDLGLVEALKAECDRVNRSGAVSVRFASKHIPQRLHQDTALCLFRVAQEALRNVERHAGATSVDISISVAEGGLRLAVSDNGTGFDTGRKAERPSLGLASIRERVKLLKGHVDIDSIPGHGTTLLAWVPLGAAST
jgi:signal transduction histidine kinase